MNCIAIDLHTDNFTVARRKCVGEKAVKVITKYNLSESSLSKFINTLSKDDYVAIESTMNAFWFHDRITPYVKQVFIFDVGKINFKGNKTDKIDAKKLLDVLEYFIFIKGENEIPKVFVPEIHVRQLRELFSTYRLQKKIITQYKNRIHSIFKQHGKKIKRKSLDSRKGKGIARDLPINEISKYQINILLQQLEESEKSNKQIIELIMALANKYFQIEIDLLLTIPGFSPITAAALLADIADINRFKNVKNYCSYLRTAPKIKESNNKTHLGKVNKNSRSLTVTLMTQSINHFRDSALYFNDFYHRLKAGKSYGKTRMALIRKILVSTYYMLKRKESFKWSDKTNITQKRKEFQSIAKKIDLNFNKSA